MKNTHGSENQLELDLEGIGYEKTYVDDNCYCVRDMAEYIQKSFNGMSNVQNDDIWNLLEIHPVFPSDGFRNEIKRELKCSFNVTVKRSSISFKLYNFKDW